MKKTIYLVITILLGLNSALLAQTTFYNAHLKISPDSRNRKGCVLTINDITPNIEASSTTYKFNIQELSPNDENEYYFKDIINKDWSFTFLNNELVEKLSEQNTDNNHQFLSTNCVFNGVNLYLEMKLTPINTKEKTKGYELSFLLDSNKIGINYIDAFEFKITLTPQ